MEKTRRYGIAKIFETKLFNEWHNYREMMMMYNCAIREVRTKFEVLNDDLSITYKRNPIEMIKSRVKSPESLLEKIRRKGLSMNFEKVQDEINDIAGVRVICSFIDDIYTVVDMFTAQDDIKVIEVKDYIKNPKNNGYRSYHLIVEVPVFFANSKKNIKVEVQFRTIAMDFWASLEHQMKYKKDVSDAEVVATRLKDCADIIANTDIEMQNINELISK